LLFRTISVTAWVITDNPDSGLSRKKDEEKKLILLCSTLLLTAGYFQSLTINDEISFGYQMNKEDL